MPAWLRAGLFAALFVFAAAPLTPVQSAEKTFQDAALDDAAIKLEQLEHLHTYEVVAR